MRERRLEEILEECLAAYLEGRRSVEESLSLYPSLADRLEPLLRTAVLISEELERYSPPAGSMELRRARFLRRAAERRMVVREDGRAGLLHGRRWMLLPGVAAALAVAGLIVTGTLTRGGGEPRDTVFFRPQSPSPTVEAAAVQTLYARINTLTLRASRGRAIEGTDIENLNLLAAQIDDSGVLDEESRQDLQAAAEALVQSVTQSAEQPEEVTAGLVTLTSRLQRLGVVVSTAVATSTPSPSPSPMPTGAAQTPAASGSPTPTPTVTSSPEPISTP